MQKLPRTITALTILAITLFVVVVIVGDSLISPAKRSVGTPPVDLQAESVIFTDSLGISISGWFARGKPNSGSVLLLHGIRSDRRQMLERAKFLSAAGYSTLLIDLPAHGESDGKQITFGYREAEGVKAAMRFLRKALPEERIGVIGVSLGAASLVIADDIAAPEAVILESMYPTIENAVENRLKIRFGSIGSIFAPAFLWQLPLRLGISTHDLRPIEHLSSLRAPVLFISGTEDLHTTATETKKLFDTAIAPKDIWLVEGASHVDLYDFSPQVYESKVSAFLLRYLRRAN